MAGSPRGRRTPASSPRVVPTPRPSQPSGPPNRGAHPDPPAPAPTATAETTLPPEGPRSLAFSPGGGGIYANTRLVPGSQAVGRDVCCDTFGRGSGAAQAAVWALALVQVPAGQRPSLPGSRRRCRRPWLWSGWRPGRRRRVRRPPSRRRLRMRHRRRLHWPGRPASRAARRRVRRGLRQARPVVMAARTLASGEPACGEVPNG